MRDEFCNRICRQVNPEAQCAGLDSPSSYCGFRAQIKAMLATPAKEDVTK